MQRVVESAGLRIDRSSHEATAKGQKLDLGKREYQVLELLLTHEGILLPREMFWYHLFGSDRDPFTNTVAVSICRLRKKLSSVGIDLPIESFRSGGYRFRDRSSELIA